MNPRDPSIRVGLAGCGRIARRVHLPILAAMPGVRVTAIAEADPDARAQASRHVPSAQALADYRELCALTDLDAVVICLPTGLHADAGLRALEAGHALYLEKPIATSLADAERLVSASARAPRPAMTGFNYRFHPLALDMRARVAAGQVGAIVACRTAFSAPAHTRPAWKMQVATGGGVLLDYASHHVDLLRWMTGCEVRVVSASIQSVTCEEDTASLQMTLEPVAAASASARPALSCDRVPAQMFCSWNSSDEDRLEMFGTRGRLSYDRYASLGLQFRGAGPHHSRGRLLHANLPGLTPAVAAARLRAPLGDPSYAPALRYFIDCVRDGRAPSPSLVDGLRSVQVVAAAQESARLARPVTLAI
jgi:predicted dehydrogenase